MRESSGELYIHETATVDPNVTIGAGTRIWHFSHIRSGATIGCDVMLGQNSYVAPTVVIGDRTRVQNNVSLYDGVTLEEDVFVGPSAVFTNILTPRAFADRSGEYQPTFVRRGASIGANATLRAGIEIGAYAIVGAGTVVLHDVAPHRCVVGNPARELGWVCRCGEPIEVRERAAICAECDARFRLENGVMIDDN